MLSIAVVLRPSPTLFLTFAGIICPGFGAEYLVGMAHRDFVDDKRPNWTQPAKPRPLSTWIWYPAAAGSPTRTDWGDESVRDLFPSVAVGIDAAMPIDSRQYPLVVMSHGSQSLNLSLMWLGSFLASKGFIVAGVNHHGNTGGEPKLTPQGFILMSDRVKDLSVLIDRMLADPMFGPRIDPQRIAAVGHSAGGATVIQLAGGLFDPQKLNAFCIAQPQHSACQLPPIFRQWIGEFEEMAKKDPALRKLQQQQANSFRDARVRAVVSLAPAVGQAFDAQGLSSVTVPVQIVVGSADAITPPNINANHYAKLIRGARLTVIPHAGHMVFGSMCTEKGKEQLSVICKDEAGVDRGDLHERVQQLTSEFFEGAFKASSIRR